MPPDQWQSILSVVTSVFLVVATGMAARRLGWLTAEADKSLLRLVIRVLIPCLIFRVVVEGTWEIKKWILGWGKYAEVLSPGDLRQEIKKELAELAKVYA